jgi:hypothetical protein
MARRLVAPAVVRLLQAGLSPPPWRPHAATGAAVNDARAACCLKRLAIFAMVARLQPVARWIDPQDCPASSRRAIPSLRSASSGRPL